ncbi:MAG TPA: Mu-like prophage major head subunit gpT family protein [Chloroflexota bacterium]
MLETTDDATLAAPRRTLAVTLIRAGTSHNRLHYPASVLEAAIPLFEGAAAFVDHPSSVDQSRAGGRSLRDLAGVYRNVRLDGDRLHADLVVYPNAAWAYALARQAIQDREAGLSAPRVGISADMRVHRRASPDPAATWLVDSIAAVQSADLVFQPSAGGSFDRVLESEEERHPPMNPTTTDAASASPLPLAEGQAEGVAPTVTATPPSPTTSPVPGSPLADAALNPQPSTLNRLRAEAESDLAAIRAARLAASASALDARLAASTLPEPARRRIRQRFADTLFELPELDAAIQEAVELIAELTAPSVIHDLGAPRSAVVRQTPLERVQLALDRLFGLDLPDAAADVPRFTGIREAYVTITGDRALRGYYDWESSVVREANEVTTSILAGALANSMTKRIVKDYLAQPKWWQPLVIRTAISDFKQQQRIHLNDFASLSTVAESGAYANLAWGDTRETYTPAKRGNSVVVTWEAIVNDDTGAITRIPPKLAAAAVHTVNDFVASLFSANAGAGALLADTFSVFDAANHQGNAIVGPAGALSSATLQAALIAILKMTNSAGKRLGIQGRYLLVPPDLYFTARTLLNSELMPGTNNNDYNPVRGALEPISVPNFLDSNNWYVLADPAQIEMLELGFLGGREVPELLLQDQPTAGAVFANDQITWKVRHVFGGTWLDYRGGYGAIVP